MKQFLIVVAFFSVFIISSCANKKPVGIKDKADSFIKTLHLPSDATARVDIKDSTLSFEITTDKDTTYSYWLSKTTMAYCFFINTYVIADSIYKYSLVTLSYKSKAKKFDPVGYLCTDRYYDNLHNTTIANRANNLFWKCDYDCATYEKNNIITFSVSVDSVTIAETASLRNFTDVCAPLMYKYILQDSANAFDKMVFYYSGRIGKKIKTFTIVYPTMNELFTKLH